MTTKPVKLIPMLLISSTIFSCSVYRKLKDDIGKITNQTVLSGIIIGSDDFEHELIDPEEGSFVERSEAIFSICRC